MLLMLLACSGTPTESTPPTDHCDEMPTGKVTLPADDSPHSESIEWWYWVGHLQDALGNHYGFHEVFFLFNLGGPSRLTGFAMTDAAANSFPFWIGYSQEGQTMPQGGFTFSDSGQTAEGGDGHDVLHGEANGYALDLALESRKAPVLQHDDGYTDYDFGGYTYYYSRTRMDARGTLQTPSGSQAVTGEAWFDHQWGNLLSATTLGWQWAALQLDDGRDIMVYQVNSGGGPDVVGASISDASCAVTEVPADQASITGLSSWTSPHTGCTYPSGWTVKVGDETYTLAPVMQDQELYNSANTYWEGEVVISGDATGRGYVELSGYCRGSGM